MHIRGLLPAYVAGDVKQASPVEHNQNGKICHLKMYG